MQRNIETNYDENRPESRRWHAWFWICMQDKKRTFAKFYAYENSEEAAIAEVRERVNESLYGLYDYMDHKSYVIKNLRAQVNHLNNRINDLVAIESKTTEDIKNANNDVYKALNDAFDMARIIDALFKGEQISEESKRRVYEVLYKW